MKNIVKVSLLAAAVAVSLSACQKKDDTMTQETKEPVASTTPVPEKGLQTFEQKSAYAIGFSMGRYIGNTLEQQQKLGVTLENQVLLEGVKDALAKQGKMDDKKLQEVLKEYDQKIGTMAKTKAAEEAKVNLTKGEAFLVTNAKREDVKTTKDGLQYEVITEGKGPKPTEDDLVKVHYTGTLLDGTEFDSSRKRGEPATFPVNQVIPGWTEALQLMPVGSHYKLYIPAKLAYGERNAGAIPPNSTLIFDVELLSITKNKDQKKEPAMTKNEKQPAKAK